jgi:hypothetical protein
MKMNNKTVIRTAEQQKKFDEVKEHYKMLMNGRATIVGASSMSREPVQHHALCIQGGGTFLPPEKVNTAWFRVDNSVRKSKWKCLGHYDEDGLDEDGDKAYDGADSEDAKDAKKKRKAYRRAKETQEAKANVAARSAAAKKGVSKNLLASEVGAWADE